MPAVGGIKAGNAYVVIGAIDDTGKMLSKIARNLVTWGRSLTSLGIDSLFKTAFAAAPLAMGLRTFRTFDDLMRQTQARTAATSGQIQDLSNVARTAGTDLGLTANDLAKVFSELSTRDFGLADMKAMARPIALLAKATGSGSDTDMQQATKLMSISLQAFKMNAGDAARIADVMTVAANKSNFALDDLRESLAHIGPLAHNMGMGLEETVAILAQMRNVEIDAASAGIGLRNILLNSANSKEVEKFNQRLKEFGEAPIEFLDKMGNLRQGTDLLFEVFSKLRKFGTGVRANLLEELFGKRAITAAVAAGSSQESFNNLLKSMKASGGEAQRIAHIMEAGIGGAWRRLVGLTTELAISLGTALEPVLSMLGNRLEHVIKFVRDWILVHPNLTKSILVGLGAMLSFSVSTIALGTALKFAGYAVRVLTLNFILFDVARKTVAVGLVVLQGILWTLNLTWTAFTAIVHGTMWVFNALTVAFGAISIAVTTVSSILSAFMGVITTIASLLPLSGVAGVALIVIAVGGLALAFMSVFDTIKDRLKMAQAGFIQFGSFLGDFCGFIGSVFSTAWSNVVNSALAAFQTIKNGLSIAFDLATIGQFNKAWDVALMTLKVSFLDVWDEIVMSSNEAWGSMLLGFHEVLSEMVRGLNASLVNAKIPMPHLEGMRDAMQAMLNPLARGATKVMQNKGQDRDLRDLAKEIRHDKLNTLIDELKDEFPELGKAGPGIIEAIQQKLPQLAGAGMPVVQAGGKAPQALQGLERGTVEAAKAFYEAKHGLDDAMGADQLAQLKGINAGVGQLVGGLGLAP